MGPSAAHTGVAALTGETMDDERRAQRGHRLTGHDRRRPARSEPPADIPARHLAAPVAAALVAAAGAFDEPLADHLRAVEALSREIGLELGLYGEELGQLCTGALLHDVGKISLDRSILNKNTRPSADEYEQIKRHPSIGTGIVCEAVSGILPGQASDAPALEPDLEPVLAVIRSHHERYDGNGYPEGLRAAAIPPGARITAVADAAAVMRAGRPYRGPMDRTRTLAELRRGSASQFDPRVVEALGRLWGLREHQDRP